MVNTRGQDGPSRRPLRFRERLTGKSLTTDALLKKLKALQTELEELQTEKTELSTLNTIRKDLIHSSLLLHKDRGVKAYVAAALADLLRIHAPDAPFTPAELHDIFEFMLRQLTAGLSGAEAPYYAQYFRVLEQLASSKSVVLVCDLPHADTLMTSYFKEFFNIARRDIPRKVEMLMADILSVLVDETNNLPLPILEKYLLPQFQSQDLVRHHVYII
jgi:sister chromatid cohesion protein PDS5